MDIHYFILFLLIGFIVGAWTQKKRLQQEISKLKKLTETDDLTGLKNSRAFKQRYEEEWERSKRNNSPLSLILLDLDNFKNVNTILGYQKADYILQQTAAFLLQEVRKTDLVFRYKIGDEFAILIPGNSKNSLQALSSRLQSKFLENFDKINSSDIQLGLSIYIDERNTTDTKAVELIKRCEEGLKQKKAGDYSPA